MSATYASPPSWAWPRHHEHHHDEHQHEHRHPRPRRPRSRSGSRLMWNQAGVPETGDEHPRGHRGGSGRRGHGHHGHGSGPCFGPGPGRRRAGRGNVRAAVLALLAEQPQHGYAVIGQLAERSGGLWRPSPGSVYPVLGQLQDDGLVTSDDADGRKVFRLTDLGRAYVADHADELTEPWTAGETRRRDRAVSLFEAVRAFGGAAREVARGGTDDQVRQARNVVDDARKALYRLLADEPSDPPRH